MTSKIKQTDSEFRIVAIDGGAASGKSTTSRSLARQCRFLHVDTGSHYRAMAWACIESGIEPEAGRNLERFLDRLDLGTRIVDNESRMIINGLPEPSPEQLRSEQVNQVVSRFAAIPAVRESIKAYQQGQVERARQAGFAGIVMEGRDIGTVILPDAHLKVFLVADPDTRQKRRLDEGGRDTIADRDRRDSSRATAPLRPSGDALLIDNSSMDIEEVVERIADALSERGNP
jgi:cytidylate kinase